MTVKKEFDSTTQREADKAKIRNENLERQKDIEAEDARQAENQEIANFQGLPKAGETREQLLDRIRQMREESEKLKTKETADPIVRTEGLQKQFEAEQEAGRAAVAKAQAEMERNQAIAAQAAREAAGEKKAG